MKRDHLKLIYSRNDASEEASDRYGKWYKFFKDGPSEFGSLAFDNGFKSYAIVDLTTDTNPDFNPELFQTNMDPSLLEIIDNSGALADCSVFEVLTASSAPFGWATRENAFSGSSKEIEMTETDKLFDDLLEQYGIFGGYCVPVHKPNGARSVIIYLGPKCHGDIHFPELAIKSAIVFDGVNHEKIDVGSAEHLLLSDLERECISGLSRGMTNTEIGNKLDYSEYVVIQLLSNLRLKLNAKTNAQAVTIAISKGEIQI